MAYAKTSSGLIFHTAFPGVALESGFTAVLGSGSTAVVSGVLDLDVAGGVGGFVRSDVPLPDDKIFVMRCKAKCNTSQDGNIIMNALNVAVPPNAILSDGAWVAVRYPFLDLYTGNRLYCEWSNGYSSGPLATGSAGVDYIWEFASDAVNWSSMIRDAATLASINTGETSFAWGTSQVRTLTDHIYPVLGPVNNIGWAKADNTYAWWQAFKSHNITVTDIESGYIVALYDESDTEITSQTETGSGSVTLDTSALQFPFTGYFEVYNGSMVLQRRLPETGTFTDFWGGDVWPGILPIIPKYFHFEFQASTDDIFSDIILDRSSLIDQTNFEYYNGSSWEALPEGGVSDTYSGNEVRYFASDLVQKVDSIYWRCRAVRVS